jgi:hypothetical protein
LGVYSAGQLSAQRAYTEGDFDLWFALSAFADNASLYEQLLRSSANNQGLAVAGRALINAARRVDTAMQNARPSSAVQSTWASIRRQLSAIDPSYSSTY